MVISVANKRALKGNPKLKYVDCNFCGEDNTRFLFKLNVTGNNVVECMNCGLIYVNPQNDRRFYHRLYSSSKYFKNPVGTHIGYLDYLEEKEIHMMNAERRLKSIEVYTNGSRILDIGCATGFFLDVARRKGWDTYGVELSEWASEHAKKGLELNVFCGELKEARFDDNFFDVVTLYGTIEHILDPMAEFLEVERILKPGGLIIVSTEDVDCFLSHLQGKKYAAFKREEHTYFFKKKMVFRMLEKAGFKVIKARDEGTLMPADYLLKRLREFSDIPFAPTILDFAEYTTKKLHLSHKIINLKYGYINIYAQKEG